MIHIVLAIQDTAVKAYMKPFFVPAAAAGVRALKDEVNDPRSQGDMFKHPEDFLLFEIGTFDDLTCRFDLLPDPILISRARDLKNPD